MQLSIVYNASCNSISLKYFSLNLIELIGGYLVKPNISKVLKALRKNNNNTQAEVAKFLGISRQAYSRYESNLREPNMETLANIATYYNVSAQVFYIDDIDKLLDSNMNLMEMVARYQLKATIYQDSKKDENHDSDNHLPKQDETLLQNTISERFDLDTYPKKHSSLKRKIVKFFFLILIGLFMINIGIMTLHRKDSNYQYKILEYSYINAITPDQNVNRTMYLDIIQIHKFNSDDIQVGDYIVIYSDFGLNEYFTEKVTRVNNDDQTITTTYDNETAITNKYTDIVGVYEKEANLFGTIYYASKFNTGYVLLILSHIIVLAIYYISFFNVKKD